jgi:hypothetical protein
MARLCPAAPGRFNASTGVLGTRPLGQPRDRSSSSPRQRMLSDVPDGRSGPNETDSGRPVSRGDHRHGGRRERSKHSATPAAARPGQGHMTHHDALRPARTWSWFVQPGEKASRQESTARVWPPATAAASPLLFPDWLRAFVGEVASVTSFVGEARRREPAVGWQQPVVRSAQLGDRGRSPPRGRRGYRNRGNPIVSGRAPRT